MASGGHLLQQQKGSVEARIKSLVVNDLKLICRAHNYQVSGTKANLQKRCIESKSYHAQNPHGRQQQQRPRQAQSKC